MTEPTAESKPFPYKELDVPVYERGIIISQEQLGQINAGVGKLMASYLAHVTQAALNQPETVFGKGGDPEFTFYRYLFERTVHDNLKEGTPVTIKGIGRLDMLPEKTEEGISFYPIEPNNNMPQGAAIYYWLLSKTNQGEAAQTIIDTWQGMYAWALETSTIERGEIYLIYREGSPVYSQELPFHIALLERLGVSPKVFTLEEVIKTGNYGALREASLVIRKFHPKRIFRNIFNPNQRPYTEIQISVEQIQQLAEVLANINFFPSIASPIFGSKGLFTGFPFEGNASMKMLPGGIIDLNSDTNSLLEEVINTYPQLAFKPVMGSSGKGFFLVDTKRLRVTGKIEGEDFEHQFVEKEELLNFIRTQIAQEPYVWQKAVYPPSLIQVNGNERMWDLNVYYLYEIHLTPKGTERVQLSANVKPEYPISRYSPSHPLNVAQGGGVAGVFVEENGVIQPAKYNGGPFVVNKEISIK